MKSAGASHSGRRRCLTLAACTTALALSAFGLALAQDDPAASAAWKTAASAASAPAPISSPGAKPSAAASASAAVTPRDDAAIAEAPMPASIPRAAASPSADRSANADASNLVPTPSGVNDVPNLSEIPTAAGSVADEPTASTSTDPQPGGEPNEITNYEQEQSGMPPDQLKALRDYDSGGALSTPIGMELTEDRRTLSSGEEADGLLIIAVAKDSPAAEAGLHAYSNTKHDMITGIAMAGAMFFPPAILLVPALDYVAVGQSYDLIIGVDGSRVRNFLDFQDRTRNIEPGEMVYLSVVRDGKRVQITVPLPPAPANMTQATK